MPVSKSAASSGAKAAKKTEVVDRRRQVAELALAYTPQHQIATLLGVSDATVSNDLKAVRAGWQEDAKADRQALIVREARSLDKMEGVLWAQFLDRNAEADVRTRTAQQILRCKERRAKMMGLDSPDLLEVTISDERVQAEIFLLRTELGIVDVDAIEA